jgi:hypothetical protein
MKAGTVFDPVDVRRLKLYPVDVVDAWCHVGDGPKRLYGKLFQIAMTTDRRKNPWPGYIYASEWYLAGLLGKSESTIRRDSAALRSLKVVRVERRSRTESNCYSFLWHPDFERADVSVREEPGERADVSVRDSADMSAQKRFDSADVSVRDSADLRGRYKEEPIYTTYTEGRNRIDTPEIQERRPPDWNGFEEFRSQYPAKNSMYVESACRAYVGRISGTDGEHDRLMAGLQRYKASAEWQRSLSENGGRYIKSMEKFISDGL